MTAHYLAAEVGRPEQYVTIYSGMEVEPFLNPPKPRETVRRELGFLPEDIVVGKVARLFHFKGHDDVIAAAKTVCAENPRIKFLFVGDGILRESFAQNIAAAGSDRAVHVHRLGSARSRARTVGGNGHCGPRQFKRRFGEGAAASTDLGQTHRDL